MLLALGRLGQARDALDDAERLRQDKLFFPSFSPALEATWARLWLHEGDVAAARSWSKESPSAATGLVAINETFTLAWINWALGRREEARDVVSALLGLARRQELGAWLVRGLALGVSNREVGRRLHIAESTVKSHLNAVYGKLAVDNRTQAAAKARALNLL